MTMELTVPSGVGCGTYRLYPGAYIGLRVWIENTGSTRLYIYGVRFEFGDVPSYSWSDDFEEAVYIDPGETIAVGSELGESEQFGLGDATLYFYVPDNIPTGAYEIRVGVYQYHEEWYGWVDDGLVWGPWETIYVYDPPYAEIQGIELEDSEIIDGYSLHVCVTVKNTGDCVAKSVRVIYYVDDVPLDYDETSDEVSCLDVGETWTFDRYINKGDYITTGVHTLKIATEIIPGLADENIYRECDTYTVTFTVKEPSTQPDLLPILLIIIVLIMVVVIIIKREKSRKHY